MLKRLLQAEEDEAGFPARDVGEMALLAKNVGCLSVLELEIVFHFWARSHPVASIRIIAKILLY